MNGRSKSSRLYCHYFQTTKSCKKEERCEFLHDETINFCPNESRCPIKAVHQEVPKRPQTEQKKERKSKKEKKEESKDDSATVENKKITVVKVFQPISFSATMVGWDEADIFREVKPIAVVEKKVESTTKKSFREKAERNQNKNDGKDKHFDENKGKRKEELKSEIKTNSEIPKNNQQNKSTNLKQKEIKSEQQEEIEETKQDYVKQTPKTVVIKKELPAQVKQFIDQYYPMNEEARNFITNFHFLKEDMNYFLPIFQNLFPKMELDLMFIVDCTGSMSSWIDAVKLEITGIVAAIRNQHHGSQIRVSFVGYRDYGDTERYSIFNFSEDLEKFQDFISKVQACGGNDAAEDVAGGFKNANSQNWKSQAKYAVLLADAPAHGIQYHGDKADFYDRYPKGDPDGVDLKKEFQNLIRKGVKLYAVEIMKSTNMMYDIFQKYNKEVNGQALDITKLGNSTLGFGQFISQTASQTLSQSYTKESKDDPEGAFFKAMKICQGMQTAQSVNFFDRYNFRTNTDQDEEQNQAKLNKNIKEITFKVSPSKGFNIPNSIQAMKAICHTYFIVQDKGVPINWRKPLVQNSSIKTSIRISTAPFAEGAMRYAFFAEDTLLKQNLVAKLNKKQNLNNPELDKEDMIKDLESQFLCQHIVNCFNDRVSEHVQTTANLKNFVHCFIYEIQNPENNYKYYSAENYIQGEYVKFNNNAGWTNLRFDEPGLLSQALSHFSYQLTEGYLMIVDLQGVGGLLTDPQIHCLDQHRFGAGNLGYQGMFKFFLSHQCNKYCQNLNLVHPNITEIPKNLKFFNNILTKPLDPKKQVFCMCDLCKVPFQTTAGYLYNKREQCFEKYCPSCDQKRQATLKSASCTSCKTTFKSSTYWFLMKRTDFPELCGPCRKLRRERMRAELK
ncbi:hypothetical protein ABPG74_006658 [Tetrahymena malaccensis]